MCGITFVINTDTYTAKLDNFLEDALIASQVRGMHSSGLFQVSSLNTIYTHKKALHASDFISEGSARTILNQATRAPLTVGHVRHATVGEKTDENAHPFLVERTDGSKLVGVHNGTLKNWKTKDGGSDHEVDSSWAFRKLADEGIDAFKSFNGAFAFVWYDSRTPDVLNCARNAERPLYFMMDETKKTILGASELGMLGWLSERNGFKISKKENQNGFMYFAAGKLYTVNLKDLEDITQEDFPAYDPLTSPEVSTSSWVSSKTNTTTNTRSSYFPTTGMYGDDHDWGDGDGRYNSYNYYSRNSSSQDSILKGVSKALKKARDEASRSRSPLLQENDEILKEIEALVQEKVADEAMFSSDPNSASATTGEQELARHMGVYGQIVDFSGVLYDESGCLCLGDIRLDLNDKTAHTAEVRGLSAKAAEAAFIQVIQPRVMTIVGAYWFGSDITFVVSSLTDQARKLYDYKVSKKTRAKAN